MIGRKRTMHPSKIASVGDFALGALSVECEVEIIMMAFFLNQTDQHDHADEGKQVQFHPEDPQCEQRAESRRRQSRQNRDRMDENFRRARREPGR